MKFTVARAVLLAAVVSLGACAHNRSVNEPPPGAARAGSTQVEFGVIAAIDRFSGDGQATGGGAVVGGVTGAVVGRQFGGGSEGRAAGTLIGAVAGALIGNQIEKQGSGPRSGVRVTVTLDRGGQRSFEYSHAGDLRVGERVRIEGNQMFRN